MSVEEKIRRAEEIYARRQEVTQRRPATVTVNNENKKDIKLLKKMIIQIIVSLLIYLSMYIIQNNNYIFSEDFLKKADEILSYDMNFIQIYENIKQNVEQGINKIKSDNQGIIENNDKSIGGVEENITENTSQIQNTNEIYETVMEVANSKVMKEKAMKMKNVIDNQMTWESIITQIEALV